MERNYIRRSLRILTSCTLLALSSLALAKEVSLYDQPNTTSKVVGKIDLAKGIIPIYTPKGDWIKVGDPRNGNVGWIKSKDIQDGSTVTFSQKFVNDGSGTQTYQKIQIGNGSPTSIDIEQFKARAKQIQAEQAEIQKAISEMMEKMNKVYQEEMGAINRGEFPSLLPIKAQQPAPVTSAQPEKTQPATPVKSMPEISPPNAPAQSSTPVNQTNVDKKQ